jgi:hypothetical protein
MIFLVCAHYTGTTLSAESASADKNPSEWDPAAALHAAPRAGSGKRLHTYNEQLDDNDNEVYVPAPGPAPASLLPADFKSVHSSRGVKFLQSDPDRFQQGQRQLIGQKFIARGWSDAYNIRLILQLASGDNAIFLPHLLIC